MVGGGGQVRPGIGGGARGVGLVEGGVVGSNDGGRG